MKIKSRKDKPDIEFIESFTTNISLNMPDIYSSDITIAATILIRVPFDIAQSRGGLNDFVTNITDKIKVLR